MKTISLYLLQLSNNQFSVHNTMLIAYHNSGKKHVHTHVQYLYPPNEEILGKRPRVTSSCWVPFREWAWYISLWYYLLGFYSTSCPNQQLQAAIWVYVKTNRFSANPRYCPHSDYCIHGISLTCHRNIGFQNIAIYRLSIFNRRLAESFYNKHLFTE